MEKFQKKTSTQLLESQENSQQRYLPPDSVEIDIKDVFEEEEAEELQLVKCIKKKLDLNVKPHGQHVAADSLLMEKPSIYKIPHHWRKHDFKNHSVPELVSIGPYHHHQPHSLPMEIHKWRALRQVLKRKNHDVNIYIDSIKEVEEAARACYEGSLCLESEDFVQMMVLDGCFILEIFQGVAAAQGFDSLGYCQDDPIFTTNGSTTPIHVFQNDMILLENQIPIFVLDRLLGIQVGDPMHKGLAAKLAKVFFESLVPTSQTLVNYKRESSLECSDQTGLHCLAFFRMSLLCSGENSTRFWTKRRPPRAGKRKQSNQLINRVTYLIETRLRIIAKRQTNDCFWDISFENGVLEIPPILICDNTESFFLNIMVFEECHLDCSRAITSYVIFMNSLIKSCTDVEHLHKFGVVENLLGSDAEVVDIFDRLCQEVVLDISNSYLSMLLLDVKNYMTSGGKLIL